MPWWRCISFSYKCRSRWWNNTEMIIYYLFYCYKMYEIYIIISPASTFGLFIIFLLFFVIIFLFLLLWSKDKLRLLSLISCYIICCPFSPNAFRLGWAKIICYFSPKPFRLGRRRGLNWWRDKFGWFLLLFLWSLSLGWWLLYFKFLSNLYFLILCLFLLIFIKF